MSRRARIDREECPELSDPGPRTRDPGSKLHRDAAVDRRLPLRSAIRSFLPRDAKRAKDSEALTREHVELSADGVAVERGQVLDAADLPADTVAVGDTGIAGAITAELATEPAVV